jgi:hypothetical protein
MKRSANRWSMKHSVVRWSICMAFLMAFAAQGVIATFSQEAQASVASK